MGWEKSSGALKRGRGAFLQGYALAATLVFGALAYFAKRRRFMAEDQKLTRDVQQVRTPWLDAVMFVPSALGFKRERYLFSGLIILALFGAKQSWDASVSALTILADTLVVQVLKWRVDDPRPSARQFNVVEHHHSPGFPSWHVAFVTAFYGFMWYLCDTELKPSRRRTLALGILGALITLIGISRVYRGAHFPSEVLGGYLLGSAFLAEEIYLHDWGRPRFEH